MISSVSNSGRISRYGSSGVPGLTEMPALAPAARMSPGDADGVVGRLGVERDVVGARLGVGGAHLSGSSIMRCTSSGMAETCNRRLHHRQAERQVRHEVVVHHVDVHPVGAVATRPSSSPGGRSRRRGCRAIAASCEPASDMRRRTRQRFGAERDEHRVGAVPVRPELHGRARRRGRRRRANSGRASSAVAGWRRSASATTPTVSDRWGEQVA